MIDHEPQFTDLRTSTSMGLSAILADASRSVCTVGIIRRREQKDFTIGGIAWRQKQ